MMRTKWAVVAAGTVAAVTVVAALVGCSSSNGSSSGSSAAAAAAAAASAPAHRLRIIAAENFWGSIVGQLAGSSAEVTSVVTDPNADPHSYEASSDDARAFADADYVIVNGAGYDGWAQHLLSANPRSGRVVLTVATLLGKKDGDNPHFWYSPDYVALVTDRIEADLKRLEPAESSYLDAQRSKLDVASAPVRTLLAAIRQRFAGRPVAATESIVVYLANALGLDLISPPDFMEAVAEGNDPPAPSVVEFQQQLTARQPTVLVFNNQTVTAVTTNIEDQAKRLGIPVVGVSETIQPPTESYEVWMAGELQTLQAALAT